MALSLKQVEKRKEHIKKKATNMPSTQESSLKKESRPWRQEQVADSLEITMAPAHLSRGDENVASPLLQLIEKAQRNSYVLSQITKKWNWWQQVKIYPKLKVPIPSFFHQKDK